jgi:D-aspartate ligase
MVAQWEKEVVIQEWINGGDDRVAYCLTYYDRQSQPLALYAGRKLRQWPIDCGVTALAEPAPRAWAGDLIDITDAIFRKVGYRGLGSIEFKMRPESDEPVIMEPTVGRTNKQNEIAVVNGQNIPSIAYFDMVGDGSFPAYTNLRRVKLVDGWAEPRAAWLYYRSGRLTFGQWLSDWRGEKRYMRFRLNDPAPYAALLYRKVRGFAGRIVRSVVGKK